MSVVEAVQAKLVASALATELATYDFGDAVEAPAVFTIDPIPEDAELPAIVVTELGGSSDFGTRAKRGAEVDVDVRLWGDKDRSEKALRDLAWRVFLEMHRAHLDVDGFEEVGCFATPPRKLFDPDKFPGYLVSVRARIIER